ncbi:urea ABC transporter permease subunit UrtB [Viscerimonas tarda]
MRFLTLIVILLVNVAVSNLSAQIERADKAIALILSNDEDRMDEAVSFLADKRDAATFHFIDAAVNGNLYKYNDIAVGVEHDSKADSYYRLYPLYEKIDETELRKEELVQVKVSRTNRLAFNTIMHLVNLESSKDDLRISAYKQVATSADPDMLKLLETYCDKEEQETVKLAAEQAINVLRLTVGDDSQQKIALDYFGAKNNNETLPVLNEYIKRENIKNENREIAEKYISDIESDQQVAEIAQNIFSGLSLGSILLLVALGLSIIYGLAGIINMSHGEFIMIGAYTTYCVQQFFINNLPQAWLDMAFFLSLPISFIVAALFGLAIERLIIRHLYSKPLESLLATWGISLILIQIARNIFGDLTSVKAPAVLSGGFEIMDGLILPYNRLFIMILSALIFILVYLLFQKTRLGIKIRAVTQNRNMSACVGISTKKIDMTTFMIGSGLAGIAGCAITLIGNVVPNMGQTYIVDSFLVVVTGGVGKLIGCVVSGLSMGIFSKFFEIEFEAVYGKVLMLVLIIVFLQYKSKGLFPDKGRIGDD